MGLKNLYAIIKKPEFIILIIVLAIVVAFSLNTNSTREIHLVRGLEVWQNENHPVDLDENWFDKSCKVVVYMKFYQDFHRLDLWMKYIEKYPNIPFLFYYAGGDPDKYFAQLEEIGFNHPIMIDDVGQFFEKNAGIMREDYSFIAYVINDHSVEMSNPTISNFEKLLKECSKANR
ncbi:MAG: hypothetical protein ACFHWX_18165 [Bacteroidota bacterium]